MHTFRRRGLLAAAAGSIALATSLMGAPAAQAQTVRHVRFTFPVQETITDQCQFPIDLSGTVSGDVQDFRDDAGNFVRVILHFTNVFTLSAKGTTLTERDRFNEFDLDFARNGGGAPARIVTVGNLTHIRLPSGRSVTVEAGRITEDLITGEVTMNGHFTISNGDTDAFCAAF
jgi:hypothetical protein